MKLPDIGKYEVISFDIFDTLVVRNVLKPIDIFELVELKFKEGNSIKNPIYFKEKRIAAEKKAREIYAKNEEVTIAQIYNELLNDYDKDTCNKLESLEKSVEISFCQMNNDPFIRNLYEMCKKRKKIIITSDMYLDRKTICSILKKAGIDKYCKLYLSSEMGLTKATGDAYDYICNDLKIDKSKIIHIGDNRKSDYIVPMKKNIKSILYKKKKNKIDDIITKKCMNFEQNIINNFIINNIKKDEYYYQIGYSCLGPLLLGFCKWLYNEATNKKIKKIFFMSRDGYIIKKAFNILYPNFDTVYMYGSRRSIITAAFWKAKNKTELFEMMTLPKNIKLKHLLIRLGFDDCIENINVDKFFLDKEKEYCVNDLLNNEKFDEFFNEYFPLIKEKSKKEYENLNKYLDKIEFKKYHNMVDIGWFGTMQRSLEKLLGMNINGYYVGVHQKENNIYENEYGYLFSPGINTEMAEEEYLYDSILEFLFSTYHGSVKRFDDSGNVELYEYEYKGETEEIKLKEIQNGAIKFLMDINNEDTIISLLGLEPENSISNLTKIVLSPTVKDAINFGLIRLKNDDITYIANPSNNLFSYLIRPRKFKCDFEHTTWKIGFLKKLVKLPLPYNWIVKTLKAQKNRRREKI